MLPALAFLLVAATAAVGWLPFASALVLYLIASAAYIALVLAVERGRIRLGFAPACALAFALRAVCLPHPPSLSDDVWRYVHEGRLVLGGHSPYTVAPRDVPASQRGPEFAQINNPDLPAAYPPAVQVALAAGAAIAANPLGMKLVFGGLDFAVFLLLWRGLPRIGVPAVRAIVHGCCPLAAVEYTGQAHSDSLAVLAVVVAVLAAAQRRSAVAGAGLAVATAAKLMPIVLLPFALRGGSWRRGLLAFALVLAGLYAPFVFTAGGAEQVLGSTGDYARRWRSNDTLYALFAWLGAGLEVIGVGRGATSPWLHEAQGLAKIPLLLAALGVLTLCWRRALSLPHTALVFFVFFVACAPTVHPWYVGFLLPWLCVVPNLGLLAFTGTVFLAYHVLPEWRAGEGWHERAWVKAIEYAPFYGGVIGGWARGRGRGRGGAAGR